MRDLTDMVLRDRNPPSIILWSIGNEIQEQWQPQGSDMAMELSGIVKSLQILKEMSLKSTQSLEHLPIYKLI